MHNYDCHPNEDIRDSYNFNLKFALLTLAWNICLILTYRDWRIFLLDLFGVMVPILMNLLWILLKDDH